MRSTSPGSGLSSADPKRWTARTPSTLLSEAESSRLSASIFDESMYRAHELRPEVDCRDAVGGRVLHGLSAEVVPLARGDDAGDVRVPSPELSVIRGAEGIHIGDKDLDLRAVGQLQIPAAGRQL